MARRIGTHYVVRCAPLSFITVLFIIAAGCSVTPDDGANLPSSGGSSGGALETESGGDANANGGRAAPSGGRAPGGATSSGGDFGPDGGGGTTNSGGKPGLGGTTSTDSGGSCTEPDPCGICGGDGSSCECTDPLCQAIVLEHNMIRAAVNRGDYYEQPRAEPPIPLVVWDPLIAAKAQEYADSMDDWSQGHSSSEFRTYKSTYHDGYHGENMAIGGGRYAEPAYFVAEGWGSSEAQGCLLSDCGGHYTQIVWRDTIAIGCGRKEGVTFDGNVGTLTVCEYGPGGNINGRSPY
jgi:pathogenesis-related protein 1